MLDVKEVVLENGSKKSKGVGLPKEAGSCFGKDLKKDICITPKYGYLT